MNKDLYFQGKIINTENGGTVINSRRGAKRENFAPLRLGVKKNEIWKTHSKKLRNQAHKNISKNAYIYIIVL